MYPDESGYIESSSTQDSRQKSAELADALMELSISNRRTFNGAIIALIFSFCAFFEGVTAFIIFPDVPRSILFLLLGLFFMGMAAGIYRRSRVCAIITTLVLAVDAIIIFFIEHLVNLNETISGTDLFWLVPATVAIVIAAKGVKGCVDYHLLIKRYPAKGLIGARITEDKRRVNPKLLTVCIAVIAISFLTIILRAIHV